MIKIVCDTRTELETEIIRVCDAINSLIPGEKVTSGYILYTINEDSLEATFQHQVSIRHKNPSQIAFNWRSVSPCNVDRCIPTCRFCNKSEGPIQPYCNCSWGREYVLWDYWIATPEEIERNQDGESDINNMNRGIL